MQVSHLSFVAKHLDSRCVFSHIQSDSFSEVLFGVPFGILSHICLDSVFDIVSGMLSGVLAAILSRVSFLVGICCIFSGICLASYLAVF